MAEQKQTRGRSGAGVTESQAASSRVEIESGREESAHKPKGRPARVPMSSTSKLGVAEHKLDRERYQYRWFQSKDGRIEQAQQAWWEHVVEEDGVKITRPSGLYPMFLMKIEKKYWDEDQKLKQQRVIDTLKAENELKKDEYVPGDKHHILQKDDYDPLG